jgi:hypothetical protein
MAIFFVIAFGIPWGSVMPGKDIARISFPAAREPPDWLRAVVVIALAVIVVVITGPRLRPRAPTQRDAE